MPRGSRSPFWAGIGKEKYTRSKCESGSGMVFKFGIEDGDNTPRSRSAPAPISTAIPQQLVTKASIRKKMRKLPKRLSEKKRRENYQSQAHRPTVWQYASLSPYE